MIRMNAMYVTEMNENTSGQKDSCITISNEVKENYRKWRRKKKRKTISLIKVKLQDNRIRDNFVPLAVEFFSYEDHRLLTFGSLPNGIQGKSIASKRDASAGMELFQEDYKSHSLWTLKDNSITCETSEVFDKRFSRAEMEQHKSNFSQLLRGTSSSDKYSNFYTSGQKDSCITISNEVKENYRKWRRKKKRKTISLIPNGIQGKSIASKRDASAGMELFQEDYKSHSLWTLKDDSITCETSEVFDKRFSQAEMEQHKSNFSQLLRGTSSSDKYSHFLKGNCNGRVNERCFQEENWLHLYARGKYTQGHMSSKFSERLLPSEREQPLQTLGITLGNGETLEGNLIPRVSKVCFRTQGEMTNSQLSQQCPIQERKLSFESFKPTTTEFRKHIDCLKDKCVGEKMLLNEFSKTNQNLYLISNEVNENAHIIFMNVSLRHHYFNLDSNHALWVQYLSLSTIAIVESQEFPIEIKESDITSLLRKHIKNDISAFPAFLSLCFSNSGEGCIIGAENNTHNEYVDDVLTYRKFLKRLNETYNLVGMELLSLQCVVPGTDTNATNRSRESKKCNTTLATTQSIEQLLSRNADIEGASSFLQDLNSMEDIEEINFLYTWNEEKNEFSVNYLNSMDGTDESCGDYLLPTEYPRNGEELESNLWDEKMAHDYGCHNDFIFRSSEAEDSFEHEVLNYQRHLEKIERKYDLVKIEIYSWILDEKFDDEMQPPIHVSDDTDKFNTIYMFLNNHTRYASSKEHWMRFKALSIDYIRHRCCKGCISSESDSNESTSPVAELSEESELNDSESSLDGSFKRFRRGSRDSTSSSDSEESALWFQDDHLDRTESNNFPVAPECVNSSGLEEKSLGKKRSRRNEIVDFAFQNVKCKRDHKIKYFAGLFVLITVGILCIYIM